MAGADKLVNLTATLQRLATQDVTLSDGTFLPKGTKMEFPAFAFHRDDDLHENAAQFDGYRFLRKRQGAGEGGGGGKHQYVSVRKDMLGWGYGKNACPGRFLADIEIKLVIVFVLVNYDIKNPEGEGRYPNIHFENQVISKFPQNVENLTECVQVFPNLKGLVLVRKIRSEDIGPDGRVMGT